MASRHAASARWDALYEAELPVAQYLIVGGDHSRV